MLIQTSHRLKKDTVTGFKLTTGEEIIAKIKSIDGTETAELENPMVLTNSPQGVGLAPAFYLIGEESTRLATIYLACLIAHFKPSPEFIKTYESAVIGLVLPETKIIT